MLKEICYDWLGYNQQLFSVINLWINEQQLAITLAAISKPFFIGYFSIAYRVLCCIIYMYLSRQKTNQELFRQYYRHLVIIGSSYALFGFLYAGLKFGINLPRPYCSLAHNQFMSIMDFSEERCLSSFPSAHTGIAILIAYFLWPLSNSIARIGILCIIMLVALARIALAMHYPADIIYGGIIALIVIKLTQAILRNKYIDKFNGWVEATIYKILF